MPSKEEVEVSLDCEHIHMILSFSHFLLTHRYYHKQACFKEWEKASESDKRKVFIDFMTKKVNLNKVDNSMLITGIVTPPAAMAAKRAGENVTQLKVIKAIPDVLFVPSVTVLALIFVKVSRRMFMRKIA